MKWYNKDRTKMIDIDSIDGYVYVPAKEYIAQNPEETDIDDFKSNGDKIEIILNGTVFVFRGDVAKELFGLINSDSTTKEILGG